MRQHFFPTRLCSSQNDVTYLLSCHKAQKEFKPEEADLFLRMDTLKDSDGKLPTPFRPCGFATMCYF